MCQVRSFRRRLAARPEPRRRAMAREYQVISTDDHIIEPHGLFDGRLPKEFADRTPVLKETDETAAWEVPGVVDDAGNPKPIEMSGLSTAAGQKVEEFSPKSKTF